MFTARDVGSESINLVQELAHATWPAAYGNILSAEQLAYMLDLIYSPAALERQISQLKHQFIILYENNSAIGFASISPKENNDPAVYRLHKLYVLPSQQARGAGKFLISYILEKIKNDGAQVLELNVNRHNPAYHFYTKLGFTVTREEDIAIGNGYFMNDYVMELSLK